MSSHLGEFRIVLIKYGKCTYKAEYHFVII